MRNGREGGNPTFDAYALMRQIASGLIGAIMVYAGAARVMEKRQCRSRAHRGRPNKVLANSMIFMVVILIFPPLWDAGAVLMNDTALWVLNPDYSFDPQRPCPEEWYYDENILYDNFNASPYQVGAKIDPGFPSLLVGEQNLATAEFCLRAGVQGEVRVSIRP